MLAAARARLVIAVPVDVLRRGFVVPMPESLELCTQLLSLLLLLRLLRCCDTLSVCFLLAQLVFVDTVVLGR